MTRDLSDRIQKIEAHINETLRVDLRKVLDEGDRFHEEISEYLQLRNLIEKLDNCNMLHGDMKTMVDLGCNVYAKAVIPSLERIYVDIGLGFHLECERKEALKIIESRIAFLNERAMHYKQKANSIKARIKFMLEGLRELQNIPRAEPVLFRDL
ncbi:Ubiquitously-expressed transcript [Fasciolopsis buskii]|uniref:Ubiquitously-expressed transcript n=1 Tax=Fasciolopsis buskii TaxID=27845 RepID=A0A8E0S2J6_9TREM|nr:Ubiquitously-expressed transcript [Fasciolopsis buski]